MTNQISLYIGSLVVWIDRFGMQQSGIVVKETLFAHSPMASEITVWSDTNLGGSFVGLSPYGITLVKPYDDDEKRANLVRANNHIRVKYSEYPIWKERIDNGDTSLFAVVE